MPKNRLMKSKLIIFAQLLILFFLILSLCLKSREAAAENTFLPGQETKTDAKNDYIHWVDFTVPADVLEKAFRLDISTCQDAVHLDWIELLSWLGARYGGDFSRFRQADLDALAERLKGGEAMDALTKDMKYYSYYHEAYTAVLGGMVGYFEQEIDAADAPVPAEAAKASNPSEDGESLAPDTAPNENSDGQEGPSKIWVTKYGLKAYSPIAKGFPYNDYDDFGVARSYGFKRQHLGHDMMGQVGTPVIAVESGTVEALGWNQYGGWRIGIRSFDKKRYYYYAHLRKNYPYQSNLEVGSTVTAGDVIGYLGRTGYSTTENTNNIDTPHLHFGLQLIFDESQKEGNNEIWIDCYQLIKFLHMNQSQVVKVEGTKEWTRIYNQKEREN